VQRHDHGSALADTTARAIADSSPFARNGPVPDSALGGATLPATMLDAHLDAGILTEVSAQHLVQLGREVARHEAIGARSCALRH